MSLYLPIHLFFVLVVQAAFDAGKRSLEASQDHDRFTLHSNLSNKNIKKLVRWIDPSRPGIIGLFLGVYFTPSPKKSKRDKGDESRPLYHEIRYTPQAMSFPFCEVEILMKAFLHSAADRNVRNGAKKNAFEMTATKVIGASSDSVGVDKVDCFAGTRKTLSRDQYIVRVNTGWETADYRSNSFFRFIACVTIPFGH